MILFFSILLKFIFLFSINGDSFRFIASDSYQYLESANTLLTYGTFSHSMADPIIPEMVRTPGYPLFIALINKIFGQNITAIIIFQILLSAGSIFLLYKIILILFQSQKWALIGSLLLLFDPITFSLSFYILTETLFQFLIISFLYIGIRFIQLKNSFINLFLLGLVLAVGILVRPVAQFLFVSMFLGLSIHFLTQKTHFLTLLKHLLTLSIPVIMLAGGWMVRNNHVSGRFVLSNMSSLNLYTFKAPGVLSTREGISLEEAQKRIIGDINVWDYVGNNPSSPKLDQWTKKSIKIITSHPLFFIKIMSIGMINTLFGPGDGQFYSLLGFNNVKHGPLGDILRLTFSDYLNKWIMGNTLLFFFFIWAFSYLFILYYGIIMSVVKRKNRFRMDEVFAFIGLVFLYFLFLSGGIETNYRFRSPMIPILIIFSIPGLRDMSRCLQQNTLFSKVFE